MTRIALDANLLVYAQRVSRHPDDPAKIARARLLIEMLSRDPAVELVIPVQALAEVFNVLVRKGGRDRAAAREIILELHANYAVAETTETVLTAALDLAADHQYSIFDAIIVNAAAEAGCRALISEDMQDGFTWRGVRIVAPFATEALIPAGLR